jgi:hypothetical protein
VDIATARHAVNTAALARDRVGLVGTVAWLPVTMAFAYERHRARAYAHALEGSGDAARAELTLGAASLPPSAAVLAADAAALDLLLGDPARSIATLTAAARTDPHFDDFGRDVLLVAIREAPSEWRRAARVAALVRHPRAAMVVAGAVFDSLGNRPPPYRVALATTGLAAGLVALLALPSVLVDGGAPGRGVTAPSFAAPPSVVVVPEAALRPLRPPDAAEAAQLVVQRSAALVRATGQAPGLPPQGRHPARPSFARPAPARPAPAPGPGPASPAPAPEPPPVVLSAAPPAQAKAPAPAAPTVDRKPKTGKGKAKGHEKQTAKAVAPVAAATEAPPQPPAPAPETTPAGTSEPPGHEKHDDKDKKDQKK